MAADFTFSELLQALQYAVTEAHEMADNQHMRQIAEYFDDDGLPIYIPLKVPNPAFDPGNKDSPQHLDMHIPKLSLVPQSSMVMDELTVDMRVPIGDVSMQELSTDEGKYWDALTKDLDAQGKTETCEQLSLRKALQRRPSKRNLIQRKARKLLLNGKCSFFTKKNKNIAKVKITFKGGDAPEVLARIEQSLVKNIEV